MRRTNTEPLKDVIQRFLKIYGADRKIKEVEIQRSWGKVVGIVIENQTEFVKVENSKLYVKLKSSVLKHELLMMRSEIIKRLNNEAGQEVIEEIVLL